MNTRPHSSGLRPKPVESATPWLWLAVSILAVMIAANVLILQRLYDGMTVNAETAGRLPREVSAASPCSQCRAGGCSCCRCEAKK